MNYKIKEIQEDYHFFFRVFLKKINTLGKIFFIPFLVLLFIQLSIMNILFLKK